MNQRNVRLQFFVGLTQTLQIPMNMKYRSPELHLSLNQLPNLDLVH